MSGWMVIQWVLLVLAVIPALNFLRRFRDSRVMGAFCVIVLSGYIWALGQHIENCQYLYWRDEAAFTGALLICYLGMCALGPGCVYFAWRFAGMSRLCRDRRIVGALFATGALFYLTVLSNGWHRLYYRSFSIDGRVYGPIFYVFTVFSYVCFGYAYLVLRGAKWDQGKSPWLMGLCMALPVLGNTAEMVLRDRTKDIVPACYCAMLAISYVVAHRYQPVHLEPIAAERVLDSMNHPVIVTGADGEALYRNEAAADIELSGLGAGRFGRGDRVYQCDRRSMDDGGTVAVLTDVTEYDAALAEQRRQMAALMEAAELLDAQRTKLMALEPIAAQLAAERQHMEILDRLSADVAGKLSALEQSIERSLTEPSEANIIENRRHALEAFSVVRNIVNQYKRR